MTTVATAYAMAQFLDKGKISGKSQPLQVAAAMADNLAPRDGAPSPVMEAPPNANQTNALRSLGTLANILAACVRDGGTACMSLFALTAPAKGPKPSDHVRRDRKQSHQSDDERRGDLRVGQRAARYEPYLGPEHGPDAPSELQRLDGLHARRQGQRDRPGRRERGGVVPVRRPREHRLRRGRLRLDH